MPGSTLLALRRSVSLAAAALRAEEVLADRQTIRLSEAASTAFSEALERPATVNDRLANALRRPRKLRWLD
jgi:uncharacterized protein (DUF1778 family)